MSAFFALWCVVDVVRLASKQGNVYPGLILMNLFLAVGMALLAARALKTRIVFQSEQVVFDLGFSQQVVPRDEILGWRVASNQLYFELRDRRKEALLVNWAARGDLRVRGWLAGIPRFDPDALLLDEAEGAVEDRQQALATARRLTLCLNVAAGILAVWMTAEGHPIAAVALVLMPVLALVLTAHSSGFIRFQKDYPNGLIAVGIACGVLPLRTSMATTAVDANDSWLFAVIIGLVFSAAAARFTPLLTEYRPWIPIVLGAALLYGYGAGMQVNRLLDLSPGIMHKAPLLAHDVKGGRTMHYRLKLGPWGDRPDGNTVEVPKENWRAIKKGATVCILVHAGALGVPWFDQRLIAACP